ncbi:MAG: hypothetical protein IH629_07535 [Thermoleophilia bacterium]|nr:hypothetical protein [Thermoleophilia bacterium]
MYLKMSTHVRDYDDWKTGFDAGEPMRTSYDCIGHEIFRDADDSGRLTIFLEFASREKGDAFLADPKLKENMAKAGVDAEPTTTWMTQTQRVDYRSRRAA